MLNNKKIVYGIRWPLYSGRVVLHWLVRFWWNIWLRMQQNLFVFFMLKAIFIQFLNCYEFSRATPSILHKYFTAKKSPYGSLIHSNIIVFQFWATTTLQPSIAIKFYSISGMTFASQKGLLVYIRWVAAW